MQSNLFYICAVRRPIPSLLLPATLLARPYRQRPLLA